MFYISPLSVRSDILRFAETEGALWHSCRHLRITHPPPPFLGEMQLSPLLLRPLLAYFTSSERWIMVSVEQLVECLSRNRSIRRKHAPVLLCPPQIPHDLTRDRTRAVAMGNQQLTAWAKALPAILIWLDYWMVQLMGLVFIPKEFILVKFSL
jgi:hypothetical protein